MLTCNLRRVGEDRTVTAKIVMNNIEAGRYTNRAFAIDASDNRGGARGRSTRN